MRSTGSNTLVMAGVTISPEKLGRNVVMVDRGKLNGPVTDRAVSEHHESAEQPEHHQQQRGTKGQRAVGE